jgi:hypothetical protein
VIGETAAKVHNRTMVRFRLLAGLLGCLAVLVAGLPVVASASAPAAKAVPAAVGEPCQHCADCGGAPCQTAMVDCVLACIAAAPALVAAAVTLPAIASGKAPWPALPAVLQGLTRPPDPFPPRS